MDLADLLRACGYEGAEELLDFATNAIRTSLYPNRSAALPPIGKFTVAISRARPGWGAGPPIEEKRSAVMRTTKVFMHALAGTPPADWSQSELAKPEWLPTVPAGAFTAVAPALVERLRAGQRVVWRGMGEFEPVAKPAEVFEGIPIPARTTVIFRSSDDLDAWLMR